MFRTALWTLRQPRYAALAVLMFCIALACIGAGTWQISRYQQSVRENGVLDNNAHAAAVPLTTELVPLVNHAPTPSRFAIEFRTVMASGSYLQGPPQLVRDQSMNGTRGFYVLNPLRTASGVLLVVRGFVAEDGNGNPPASIAAPPPGLVQITGRLQPSDTGNDGARELADGQVESVNAVLQAARLGASTYNAYVTLGGDQPGTAGVSVLPTPDLSNPAGGAYEAQHLAYILQWYLFALLALLAPFAIGRHEVREAQRQFLGIDPGNDEFGTEADSTQDQRRQLSAGSNSRSGMVAIRADGTLARRGEPTPERQRHAARMADRYGRSLGRRYAEIGEPLPRPGDADSSAVSAPAVSRDRPVVPNSADQPYRSHDPHHGSYNDYLWQLALADGVVPAVSAPEPTEIDPTDPPPAVPRSLEGQADSVVIASAKFTEESSPDATEGRS